MQEISEHIYIERSYSGVTLAAINWPHGLILIDSPFRPDDTRSWRAALLNLGGGVDRLLINLDPHPDRTLGTRAMECTVVGHEKMAQVFRNRPVSFKAQGAETGAEWELYNGLGSVRWLPPDITFTNGMQITWNVSPLLLEYRPGPAAGAIWARLPDHQLVFIGDAVTANQPPFLSGADIPAWLETLEILAGVEYQNYLIVSGRNGLITQKHVRQQIEFLRTVHERMEELGQAKAAPEAAAQMGPELLTQFEIPADRRDLYANRLRYGLIQYYYRRYRAAGDDILE